MLTLDQFKKLFPRAITPEETYKGLVSAMFNYDIIGKNRESMFLAQLAHESGGFRWDHELGNKAYFSRYDGRKDLGNTNPGDGYLYRGRGYIQLTGRANYIFYGKKLAIDLVGKPDLAATPVVASRVACQYWVDHKNKAGKNCNSLADSGDFIAITRLINGGTNGLSDRKAWLAKILKMLP